MPTNSSQIQRKCQTVKTWKADKSYKRGAKREVDLDRMHAWFAIIRDGLGKRYARDLILSFMDDVFENVPVGDGLNLATSLSRPNRSTRR